MVLLELQGGEGFKMESEGWIAVRNSVNNANRNTLCKLIITQAAAFARLFRREAESRGSVTLATKMVWSRFNCYPHISLVL